MSFDLQSLTGAVADDAAFRRRQRLQPAEGAGGKLFPPTYPGEGRDPRPRHVFERRRVGGETVWSVLLDSVQSSGNRAEGAVLVEAQAGKIALPYLSVDFTKTEVPEIGEITSLDAPHRIFDAILRDSELNGVPLMKSEIGRRLQLARLADATAILETSPNALLFGAWNSTGEGGGLGAKFPRCFVSEIVGINAAVSGGEDGTDPKAAGRRPGSRMDPLGILKGVTIYKNKGSADWSTTAQSGYTKSKPSEINHGNIAPSVDELGVTVDYAEHTTVMTCAGLRRLRFGDNAKSAAGRTLLAALGLVAHFAQLRQGYALRSRCDLVPEGSAPLELVHSDGTVDELRIGYDDALRLYTEALGEAANTGFTFAPGPIELTPQEKLVYLVKQSRELALAGKGGETAETAGAGA